ncbi:MAG: glycoside hydrolase family 20 zincin-like fold domain-containing protein [Kiritimatiellia bacterium]
MARRANNNTAMCARSTDLRLPSLLPRPRRIRIRSGNWSPPRSGIIGIHDASFVPAAEAAKTALPGHRAAINVPGADCSLSLTLDGSMAREEYALKITAGGAGINAGSPAGAFYGVQTLLQIARNSKDGSLPCLDIRDRPDFADRGIYYDVCRGRVPRLERLQEMARTLARCKINQLQLYIEHTFRFEGHPDIGKGASPLSAEDILALDTVCRENYMELVPSLASFGHMSNVLKHKRYRHLAEDRGIGDYRVPDERGMMRGRRGWTLAPGRKETYRFLDSLFAEFLPLFSSKRFNVCCDETWDLGMGRSRALCERKGKGRVYLDHILELRKLAARYGKRIMFWGDIIRKYPELIREIPEDVTVLDWGYGPEHPFDRIKDFKKAGLPFYACPGTGSWRSLFPRLPGAEANISGFAGAGRHHGARGLLTTDWGDGGHYNFMEYSWCGYLFAAEQAWNTGAGNNFIRRFLDTALNSNAPDLARALRTLGDIAQMTEHGNDSVWLTVFFGLPEDPVFSRDLLDGYTARNGRLDRCRFRLNARTGKRVGDQLKKARRILDIHSGHSCEDPMGLLPYWIFAADTMIHAARKLTVFGKGGRNTSSARKALRREMKTLMRRFEKLWMARNRRSEIRVTLKAYKRVVEKL